MNHEQYFLVENKYQKPIIINSITLRGKYLNLIFCTKCDQVINSFEKI